MNDDPALRFLYYVVVVSILLALATLLYWLWFDDISDAAIKTSLSAWSIALGAIMVMAARRATREGRGDR